MPATPKAPLTGDGALILDHLAAVAAERAARDAEPALAAAVVRVKQCQHDRFAAAYADLLAQPRYARAVLFFLNDLYGPGDFTRRDAEFARIVPALVRLFPADIVATVRTLAALHALSEQLDSDMGRTLAAVHEGDPGAGSALDYGAAWRAVGREADRQQQLELMLDVGRALDRYTRNPLLRHTLRLMRGPAQLAGLAELQLFLENGFDTFREMRGSAPFLGLIAAREHALAARLFAGAVLDEAMQGLPGRL